MEKETTAQPLYVDEHKGSDVTGWKVQTLRNWRHKGVGPPYVKVGRSVRYNVNDLIDFMERHKIEPWMEEGDV
jgi:hypothetical protein